MLQVSQKQLILTSDFSVVVFGRGEDFTLLKCNDDDASDVAEARDAAQRGQSFCGVLALTEDGLLQADIAPDNPGAVYTMTFAGLAFERLIADRLKSQQPKGDAVEFLTRLFVLPDTRTDA